MVPLKGGIGLNILLRVLLLAVSLGALVFVLVKIRKSQVQIDNAVFWILFMLVLVAVSVFPNIIIYLSSWIGIESPANFVFLCIIFLLLIKVFLLSLHASKQQYQIQKLTQMVVINEFHKKTGKPADSGESPGHLPDADTN